MRRRSAQRDSRLPDWAVFGIVVAATPVLVVAAAYALYGAATLISAVVYR